MKTIAALILSISLALTACQSIAHTPTPAASATPPTATPGPTRPPTPAATVSTSRPAPAQGGIITLGLIGQPQTLNPIIENNAALWALTPLLFDTLLRVEPQTAQLQPGLAQSWEFSEDGRQVTFRLPPNLKWSDGAPFTADDVAQSLQATRHPALQPVGQISAPAAGTLVLTFDRLDCSALTHLSLLPLLPADQILAPFPTGSGPFVVAQQPDNLRALALLRNQNYAGPAPFLDSLTVRFISPNEVDIAVSEGQFDAIGPLQGELPNFIPTALARLTYPAPQVIYVAINYAPRNESPLPPAVRQALALALDRPAILSEALAGDGQLMAGSLLPGHWAANNSLSPPEYNPQAARSQLARAGLSDRDFDGWLDWQGERLELAIRVNGANPLHQKLAWLVSSYYRDVGLYARAESSAPDSVIDDLFTHDFRLAMFSWRILPDPDQRLYWHSTENTEGQGLNFTSYNNPQLDRLLEAGVAVPGCLPEARAESYAQIQEILSQERPVDFLLTPNQHILAASRLAGLNPGPFAPFTWNVEEWYLQ